MAQRLIQNQTQQQVQQQRLTQQQMLEVKLLEMPLAQLEQNVAAELDDNPALEEKRDPMDGDAHNAELGTDDGLGTDSSDDSDDNYAEDDTRRENELDGALEDLESDDTLPTADSRLAQADSNAADEEEMVWGNTTSFYDRLKEQMGEMTLTEQEQTIMEYLIGSLDTDGLLRKPLDTICDELAIYQNVDVPVKTIERVLRKLQTFDPAGIGARSLQECLLLQIDRKPKSKTQQLMHDIIADHFDDFTKMHWSKIAQAMQLSEEQIDNLQTEIRKLNPKPGAALGETEGKNLQQVTPDFFIDTDEDGNVTFTLNRGELPELKVSDSFADLVNTYRNSKHKMSRQEKEALLYAKQKVDRAQGYIQAIRQRRHTLTVTMQAIIDWQKKFFQDGDEADLRPMILEDIAKKTHLDASTISRVSNVKYAQTPWGTFPLRYFFSDGYTLENGEEASTRKIKIVLKEVVEKEDKHKPLSDEALAAKMKEKGYPIARRTVAKYREQLGIPMARLRRE
ncbi:MAG: RNA polymerase factor sigma-54 [Prevotella sp.]|jgi:RNA polymerase sigma-54 factor